jgi:RimJ/RimL family protein N-acetyltransferase
MEKAGLHKEGILKQSRICRGKYQDVVWYGLVKAEFEIKLKYIRRLKK